MHCGAAMFPRSTIDSAFTRVLVQAGHIRSEIDFEAWCRHVRSVDAALTTFCDAIDDPKPTDAPLDRLARHAFMAVLALAQVLSGAYSEHARTSATLDSRSSRSASCSTRSSRT